MIDELFATTWSARPNGDVISWYHGRATARAIDLATQKSFEFDNSGSLLAVFHADGSVDVRYDGPEPGSGTSRTETGLLTASGIHETWRAALGAL